MCLYGCCELGSKSAPKLFLFSVLLFFIFISIIIYGAFDPETIWGVCGRPDLLHGWQYCE